jgi:hypothetical protein
MTHVRPRPLPGLTDLLCTLTGKSNPHTGSLGASYQLDSTASERSSSDDSMSSDSGFSDSLTDDDMKFGRTPQPRVRLCECVLVFHTNVH